MLLRIIFLSCVLSLAFPAIASEGDGTGQKAITFELTINSEGDGTGTSSEGDGTGQSSEGDGTGGNALRRPFWSFGWLWSWFDQAIR